MRSLHLDSVSFSYSGREGETVALRSVSCDLSSESPVYLCGPSGSGKSTLGLICARLLRPRSGRIVDTPPALTPSRRAFVFQFPEHLFIEDTVAAETKRLAPNRPEPEIADLFMRCGLDYPRLANIAPYCLSAAEGRLTAIALQIARAPDLLVLDEPTLGLDAFRRGKLLAILNSTFRADRLLLIITHDLALMSACPGEALILEDGAVVWRGSTGTLLNDRSLLAKHRLLA